MLLSHLLISKYFSFGAESSDRNCGVIHYLRYTVWIGELE